MKNISDRYKSENKRYFCGVEWNFDRATLDPLKEYFDRLESKRNLIRNKRPLPASVLEKVKEELQLEWTYNSNSIEGNTLTLQETKIVLQDGMTVKGKSMREHFEATNHHNAIAYLHETITPAYTLSEKDVLKIHSLVLQNIEKDFAGRYRNGGVRITGANFVPPNALKVPVLMEALLEWVNSNPMELNVLALAAVFHHRFVHIHPFFDGNGRTVRLLMNLLLMKEGYPPAIILKNDRKKYYEALNQANQGNYSKLLLLVLQAQERSLNIYLNSFPTEGYDQEYLEITNLVKEEKLPYSSEYISLLARTGKIDAYKEGRNWLTSKAAVQNYMKQRKKK
ncbi:MAG: Fic family protein [Bacteroidia bacterium]|nr:Fic family protein [Bacteroidia bacterium]